MAHFRGTVQGSRGVASRLGHRSSGLCVTCDGWCAGIRIWARYDSERDCDVFDVYSTGGSNHQDNGTHVVTVVEGKTPRRPPISEGG